MFLHAGNGKNIREKDIIGIFDADTATVSSVTRKYLATAQKKGVILSANEEVPKSFVLYKKGEKTYICLSQLSTAALMGRNNEN